METGRVSLLPAQLTFQASLSATKRSGPRREPKSSSGGPRTAHVSPESATPLAHSAPQTAHGSRQAAARPTVAKAVHSDACRRRGGLWASRWPGAARDGDLLAAQANKQQALHRLTKLVVLVSSMNPKNRGSIQKAGKSNHVQGGGPNWVLIAGGILLSTLSVRLGCKLKQLFVTKQQNSASKAKRRPGECELNSDLYRFSHQTRCYCGMSDGGVEVKQAPSSPISNSTDPNNLLVKIPGPESSKDNSGVMWSASPGRLEDPRKPFQYSNCSGSPPVSESGSDIYSKTEVTQKLRQQLKRRDEMIMEMQAQIADLKNSLSIQVTQNTNLQSQLDATKRDLFESEREIQHLRKIIADHCVAEGLLHDKPFQAVQWQSNGTNGHVNGYSDSSVDDPELHCNGTEKRKGEAERLEMLKREVGELKEVIEGKDFLLQCYKEQKVEGFSKIRELQEKLSAQVPNIL